MLEGMWVQILHHANAWGYSSRRPDMATIRPRDLTLTEVVELTLAGIEFPICGVCMKATIGGNGLNNHCRACWRLCSRGSSRNLKHGHYKADGLWYPPFMNNENAHPTPRDV